VTDELSENSLNHLNACHYLESQRPIIRRFYFPDTDLVDLRDETHTDFSSDNHFILRNLRSCLPFGHYLTTYQRNYIVSTYNKLQILNNARAQLLYWFLARSTTGSPGHPVNHLAIYHNNDHFWHHHIPLHEAAIIYRLSRLNQPAFFLNRFSLLGDILTIEFGELRLLTNTEPTNLNREPFKIVHVLGTEFCLDLSSRSGPIENPPWTITQFARGIALIDPDQDFFLPPSAPVDPDYDPADQEHVNYYLPVEWINDSDTVSLPSVSTPPPTLEAPTTFEPGWTNINPYHRDRACPCTTEFCRCGRRPDTPPTPPNITLWTPGDQHLPYRN
jgi:hypothetical protein